MSLVERALMDRYRRADLPVWKRQVERARFCSNPVRLSGGAASIDAGTGEVRAEFATSDQPDGVLLIACGDRRASVCPSCAEVYRRDMWHLVASGVSGRMSATSSGGAGARQDTVEVTVPSSVASHPRLFVTLTAPSFGPVHSARGGGVCRPRRDMSRKCAHGRPLGCALVHDADHPIVGTPICVGCYDYVGAVLWNACAGELWRRTRIAIDRALAPAASEVLGRPVTVAEVRRQLRTSYVKVAEFQKRGLVHLHAVIRLDGTDPDDRGRITEPPSWASANLLAAAVARAVDAAAVALPSPDGVMRVASWGPQRDITDVSAGGPVTDSRRLAAYLAKYATKTASDAVSASRALARRFHRLHRTWLRRTVGVHLARMVETAWALGSRRDLEHLNLRKWAHCLGFRGHFATKSRVYSVTLGALRAARRAWRARQTEESGQRDVWGTDDDGSTLVVGRWAYAGRGYVKAGDAMIVETMARDHAVARREYRELLRRERQARERVAECVALT
ncbi:replication initiator [Nocardiopsis rhodophaea]|uniref:replication initiator n=1 Tax=Nocardiopsis rhodophaea TaxID=280238 RepID=UPI0031E34E91